MPSNGWKKCLCCVVGIAYSGHFSAYLSEPVGTVRAEMWPQIRDARYMWEPLNGKQKICATMSMPGHSRRQGLCGIFRLHGPGLEPLLQAVF